MSIVTLAKEPLSCITKFLHPIDVQNLSSTCRPLRKKLFTDLFFSTLAERLDIPFAIKGANNREEIQENIRTTVAKLLATWLTIFPQTTMRQFANEPLRGGQLRAFQIAHQELVGQWVNSPCTALGTPQFLGTFENPAPPECVQFLDVISRKQLAAFTTDIINEKVTGLILSKPGQIIDDPIMKLCAFQISLYSTMIPHFIENQDIIINSLNLMQPSLRPHAIKYSLASSQFTPELATHYLQDTSIKWPKGVKDRLYTFAKLMKKSEEHKHRFGILSGFDFSMSMMSIAGLIPFMLRPDMLPAIDPLEDQPDITNDELEELIQELPEQEALIERQFFSPAPIADANTANLDQD